MKEPSKIEELYYEILGMGIELASLKDETERGKRFKEIQSKIKSEIETQLIKEILNKTEIEQGVCYVYEADIKEITLSHKLIIN